MRVSIIGAGNCGLAMAAHLSRAGDEVTLWNRTRASIEKLMDEPLIYCQGVLEGPVPVHRVTDDLGLALEQPDIIMVTTPANAHKELAEAIAKKIRKQVPILLNPGRTFGALEFKLTFEGHNKKFSPPIAETQTIIYTCRRTGATGVHIVALKADVLLSTFDAAENRRFIENMPGVLKSFLIPAASMIETSIGNVGMILHCAPLLLNAGWTENENNLYKYYYDGITPTISSFLEQLDGERIAVSRALGHPVESTRDWLKRSYQVQGNTLFECLQNNKAYRRIDAPTTLKHRYLFEDIPCGLVPLEAVGKMYGVAMPHTTLVIDLASRLMETDFRETGRKLEDLKDFTAYV